MSLFEILCLANSRKHGGKCIAGLRTDGKGWIRPVKQDEPLSRRDCILEDGSEVEVLDVIKIDLIGPQPEIHQPENWLIGSKPWKLVSRPASAAHQGILWSHIESGPTLLGNKADRIHIKSFHEAPAQASLTLVTPAQVEWTITENIMGRRQTRAVFKLGGTNYDLVVTDPKWENYLKGFSEGNYSSKSIGLKPKQEFLLTISLGKPLHGYCYKLVASVLLLEDS